MGRYNASVYHSIGIRSVEFNILLSRSEAGRIGVRAWYQLCSTAINEVMGGFDSDSGIDNSPGRLYAATRLRVFHLSSCGTGSFMVVLATS